MTPGAGWRSEALVDLAARRLGGMVLEASDEFFGAKEQLLDPSPPSFDPAAYGDRGKVVDGWETRRRRGPGEDWCVVRLGVPGVVDAVEVDTSHFTGNHPQAFELWGAVREDGPPAADASWVPLLPRTGLRGDAAQRFVVDGGRRVTHVRFVIHPDGGVARLRLLGRPLVDLHRHADPGDRLDLAALVNGGRAVACSDAFYSSPTNLIMVGDARDMSDGWETRRRRGPGHEWVVLRLATTGVVERIEIDTTHFKGNHPDRCTVLAVDAPAAADAPDAADDALPAADVLPPDDAWTPLVADHQLQPHARHVLRAAQPVEATHLKLLAIPDGGVARLRAFGRVSEAGWRRAGVALLDAAAENQAVATFAECCGSTAWARRMAAARPFGDPAAVLRAARETWDALGDDDRMEAITAHPRIGGATTSARSAREQSQAAGGDPEVLRRLAEGNLAYEERFGHVFLIRAAGRSAEEVLAALEQRVGHDPATERRIAAEQQAEITLLRLEALLRDGPSDGGAA